MPANKPTKEKKEKEKGHETFIDKAVKVAEASKEEPKEADRPERPEGIIQIEFIPVMNQLMGLTNKGNLVRAMIDGKGELTAWQRVRTPDFTQEVVMQQSKGLNIKNYEKPKHRTNQ